MHLFQLESSRKACRAFAIAATFIVSTMGGGLAAHAQSMSVKIDNFTFEPAELTVAPGTTVTWTNADDIPHTVTSNEKVFRSKPLDTDDHFSFTFSQAGEFKYFCSLHPHMTGKIVVKAP